MSEQRIDDVSRPTLAVVVPFVGTRDDLVRLLTTWECVRRKPGDRVVIVDNSRSPMTWAGPLPAGLAVVQATHEGSSYYARNTGAQQTESDWILFVDDDCTPGPELINAYFRDVPAADVGAVAGGVVPGDSTSFVARYSAARNVLDPDEAREIRQGESAVTANLLVRRRAYDELGGFCEGIRSGGDIDFTWRLQEAGWALWVNRQAEVVHAHRESIRDLMKQYRRYGAGFSWLRRRHDGLNPERFGGTRVVLGVSKRVAIALVKALRDGARGDWTDVRYDLTDAAVALAWFRGTLEHNRPRWSSSPHRAGSMTVTVAGHLDPDAASRAHSPIEARHRASSPRAWLLRGVDVTYWEDDSYGERLAASTKLVAIRTAVWGLTARRTARRFGRRGELLPVAVRLAASGARVEALSEGDAALAVQIEALLPQPRV